LVKNEANAVFNGVYTWSNATVITRSTDADEYGPNSSEQLSINDYFFVQSGNINEGSAWVVDAPTGTITFGTSNIAFAQFSQSQVYEANTSAGLDLAGTTFSAKVDNNTTAFDLGGNISVKAGANLTTPNIGAATGTSLSATGTVTGGNVLTGGVISATGNITGNYFIGNGSQLTGVIATNVDANALTGNTLSANVLFSSLTSVGTLTTLSVSGTTTTGNLATGGTVSATGTVTGGNVLTGGLISSTGTITSNATITGGNVATAGTVSATGTVTGGNVLTGGVVSATGTITGGNVLTGGIVSATSTITGGNVLTAGDASAGGSLTGGNIFTGGTVSAVSTVTGGNIATAGTITATGTITGGNVLTGGTVSATGTVTGGNIVTGGLITATGNISTGANVTGGNILFGSGIVSGTGNVYATNFIGNITGNIDAAGSNTEVQFNNNGLLGASSAFTFNTATNILAIGGQVTSTGAGNLSTGGGQIYLNGTGNNRIDWNTNGVAAPTTTTRSAGAKVVLYPAISGSSTDYALGVEAGALWSGIPGNDAGQFFKWYGAATEVASLSGTGVFSAAGTVTGANVLTGGIVSATGNITGNYFFGNGSQLTGIDTNLIKNGSSNVRILSANGNISMDVNGTSNVVVVTTSGISVTGNVQSTSYTLGANAVFGSSLTATTGATVAINSTDSILVPVGNTVQRPTGVTGMIRFNTTTDALEVYDSNSWEEVGGTTFTVIGDQQFAGDDSTVTFVLSDTQTTNSCIVSINGVVQIPGTAYSVTGTNLTFTEAPLAGDDIDVRKITTTTTVIAIQNSPANASITVNDTSNVITVTGQLQGFGNALTVIGDLTITGNATVTGNVATSQISNGNSRVQIPSANGNVNIDVGVTDNMAVFTTNTLFITGNISATGDVTAQNVNSLSDASLKTNVTPIENAGQVVDGLTGVGYDWTDGSGHAYGMIAQKVEEVIPEAVKTDANGIKSVNYQMVIPFLVETVKQLRQDIAEIKAQLKK
jgi:hypothetical protein